MKNDYVFAKISQSGDMVSEYYDVIVIFDVIFSPGRIVRRGCKCKE